MGKQLILAEKPSVARDMAAALGVPSAGRSRFENDKYVIVWALGHLITLATPEEISKKYQEWKMEDLPMLPKMKLTIIPKTKGHFYEVKKQLLRKDVSQVIIATDAGREGELVARWILEVAGVKKPVKRLWISSVTKKAILEGFQKLKNGKDYENLYASAESRAIADWLVGFNGTRALTVKHNASLSCGRVQTPTLEMLYQKEREIGSFRPKKYWTLEVRTDYGTFHGKDGRIFDEEKARAREEELKKGPVKITKVTRKTKKSYPGPLYDLTSLQREANERYGYSTRETQNAMQQLYERHKVLTYPRTDSRYLTRDVVSTFKERLEAMAVGKYAEAARKIARGKIPVPKAIINDAKVSDHHAIIPTEEPVFFEDFTDKERKIYDLVATRFLSHFMEPEEYEEVTVEAKGKTTELSATFTRVVNPGYKSLEGGTSSRKALSLPKEGEELKVLSVTRKDAMTTPPPFFTEGTLLSAMENPIPYVKKDSDKVKNLLKEGGGIGTVATRSDIIEKLYESDYMEKRGQYLHLTGKGRQLLDLVPEELRAPDMTAKWESELKAIEKGRQQKKDFLKEIEDFTKKITREIKEDKTKYVHQNMTGKSCPQCGKPLLAVNRKGREMEICSDRNCGYRRTISQVTNARCPQCHKKLTLIGDGDKRFFQCVCGHRESWEAFDKRRKERKNQMSKGEVRRYLEKQDKKEESINNSLADALKGLKL